MVWHTLKTGAVLVKRGLFWICKGGSEALFWSDAWDGFPPILSIYPHLQSLCDSFHAARWDKVAHYKTPYQLRPVVGYRWKHSSDWLPRGIDVDRQVLYQILASRECPSLLGLDVLAWGGTLFGKYHVSAGYQEITGQLFGDAEVPWWKQVKDIPEQFNSIVEYLGSFVLPLIEEMRAQLQQNLESISEAQYRRISFHKKTCLSEGKVHKYNIHIERENGTGGDKNKQKLKWKAKDILLLSTKLSKTLDNLHDEYLLALVHKNRTDSGPNELTVKIYVPNGHPFTSENHKKETRYFAINLNSIISCLRIWNSLHEYRKTNMVLIRKAISSSAEDCNGGNAEVKEDSFGEFRSRHFIPRNLNDSQLSALIQAVNAIDSNISSNIKLIQGPPGTGKTSMLISLLSILGHKKFRVLVCAPTNAAVSEIAIRFIKIVTSPSGVCSDKDNYTCVMTLSDLVLVGNEDRFGQDGIFGDIFLKYRVDRLSKCFLPVTGWRYRVTSLLGFLESAISLYEVFKEKPQETGLVGFSKYTRQRLKNLTPEFFEVARTLLNDLPGALSGKQELECLINAVESFVNIIEKYNVKERILTECFCSDSEGLGEGAELTSIFNENTLSNKKHLKVVLCFKRSECIQLLRRHLYSGTDIACMAKKKFSKEKIEKICLSNAKLVFSTVSSSAKRCMKLTAPFDCLIIDEAAQLTEAESTVALQIRGLRHAVLIGDPYQLPATVISQISQKAGYGRSLFQRLQKLGHPVHLLNTQYRMHPSISQFPNMEFYGNCIMDGPNVNMEEDGNAYIKSKMYGTYAFINIAEAREEEDDFGKSKRNIVEATVVLHILSKLSKVCASREGLKTSVGVIAPYSAQVKYLESKIRDKDEWMNTIDVEVKSVDGFQGGEKDIIIISTVRTNYTGFLSDRRRANVALTRARFCLWIVGNGSMLLKSKSVWKKIAKDAIERKCFLDPNVDSGMMKAIRNVKAEIDQVKYLFKKDSILFNNTVWKVTFSDEFTDSFTKLKGVKVRQQITNTILKLANGWRETGKHAGSSKKSLINVYTTAGTHLVWTTDVEGEDEAFQVLKIWNILTLQELAGLKPRLESIFSTYTPGYIERCKEKLLDNSARTVLPRRWKEDPGFVWYRSAQKTEMPKPPRRKSSKKTSISSKLAIVEESLSQMKL